MKENSQEELCLFWDYLGAHKPFSGLHTHISSLEQALLKKGLRPELLGKNNVFYEGLLALPFSKVTCPHFSSFLMRQKKGLKGKKILHSFANINTDFLCFSAGKSYRVLTVHDVIPLLAKEKVSKLSYLQFKFCLRASLGRADRVLCVSPWTKNCLERLYPEFSSKYQVLLNGYKKQEKPFYRIKKSERSSPVLKVLSVSRYEAYKGFERALELLEGLKNIEMIFVTNEPGVFFLEERAKERGVLSRLKIKKNLGKEALEEEYKKADLYLCPSEFEGYGLPAIDAMSYGLPVVYQKGHALDFFLEEGSSVALRKEASPREWKEAVEQAALLGSQKETFFKSLDRALLSLPSWEEAGNELISIYKSLY